MTITKFESALCFGGPFHKLAKTTHTGHIVYKISGPQLVPSVLNEYNPPENCYVRMMINPKPVYLYYPFYQWVINLLATYYKKNPEVELLDGVPSPPFKVGQLLEVLGEQ